MIVLSGQHVRYSVSHTVAIEPQCDCVLIAAVEITTVDLIVLDDSLADHIL